MTFKIIGKTKVPVTGKICKERTVKLDLTIHIVYIKQDWNAADIMVCLPLFIFVQGLKITVWQTYLTEISFTKTIWIDKNEGGKTVLMNITTELT